MIVTGALRPLLLYKLMIRTSFISEGMSGFEIAVDIRQKRSAILVAGRFKDGNCQGPQISYAIVVSGNSASTTFSECG